MKIPTIAAGAVLALSSFATAQDAKTTLSIGDDAPDIDIAHWLKGSEPITSFEEGKVYVIEFWATWCGPCIASMPHLSELQAEYADYDVSIISVSDEPLPTVYEFMFKEYRDGKIHNDRTQYTITTDPDGSVKKDYFLAAGQRGIPCAFIVGKDSTVQWYGHPMTMDEPLNAIVHDRWDPVAYQKEAERAAAAEASQRTIMSALREAHGAGDWEGVVAGFDKLIALGTQYQGYNVQKFIVLNKELGQIDRANGVAREFAMDNWDDSTNLNQIAWIIADEEGLQDRDLKFAMKAAMRANELTEDKDPAILDTIARIHFELGDLAEAVAWQKKAVANPSGTPMDDDIKATLRKYQEKIGG